MSLKIAVLASGSGSNAAAIFQKIHNGQIDAKVCLLICNRPGAKVLERAEEYAIPTLELDHTQFADRESFDRRMVEALQESGAELIVLAGYMRILSPYFFSVFANKVINVHPALLPSFKGAHGAADALAYGVKMTGCTVHFVDEEVDNGAIIAQAALPVLGNESPDALQKRIQGLEHRIFPQVIQWFAQKRLKVQGRSVQLLPHPQSAHAQATHHDAGSFFCPPLEKDF